MTIRTSTDVVTHWFGAAGEPVVVLIHDWYGRLPYLDALASRIADHGYRVAVPDVYAGRTTDDDGDAGAMLQERLGDMDGALRIVAETLGQARAEGSERAGLVGFSMGTTIALSFASQGSVDCVVAFYGSTRPPADQIVRVPVLFEITPDDTWEGRESPEQFAARMADEGNRDVSLTTRDGAIHGFMNADIERRFDADAAAAGEAAMLAFLDEHLQG